MSKNLNDGKLQIEAQSTFTDPKYYNIKKSFLKASTIWDIPFIYTNKLVITIYTKYPHY